MYFFVLLACVCADYSKWMSFVDDDLSLDRIVIPGTHFSALRKLAPLTGTKYITQELSIEEQLSIGVRYFDINVTKWSNDDFVIVYDYFYSEYTYNSFFEILKNFLETNPSEFIMLQINRIPERRVYDYFGMLNATINKNYKYYYLRNDIPKIRDIRKKVYLVKNLNIYYNETLTNCFDDGMKEKIFEIQTNIITHDDMHITVSSAQNEDCSYKYVSSIINPVIQSYINSLEIRVSGVIAVDYMTSSLSYDIFTKNSLQVNMYYEYLITIVIVGSIYTGCAFMYIFTKSMLYVNLFISLMNTTVHVIWICYYYYMATYINYNTLISAFTMIIILVIIIGIMVMFNLLLLMPEIIEAEGYVYKTHYVIETNSKCSTVILVIFTIFGNCNFLFRISYSKRNTATSLSQICKEHKTCYFVIIIMMCLMLLWDITTFFCIDYIFVKSSILILCMLVLTLTLILHTYHYRVLSKKIDIQTV